MGAALSTFWSTFHLERDRAELDLEEVVYETLRVLGTILEGLVKPLVLALAAHVQLASGSSTVHDWSFGKAMDVVVKESGGEGPFEILGIRASQWRNIAQHLSVEVNDERIVCRYGSGNQHVLRVRREQLESTLEKSMSLWRGLRVARDLFFLDHFEELRARHLLQSAPSPALRQEASVAVLAGGLASQGFMLVGAQLDSEWSKIAVRDMSSFPPRERPTHANQAVFLVAELFPAPMISVVYREKDGTSASLVIAERDSIMRARESNNPAAAPGEMTFIDMRRTV